MNKTCKKILTTVFLALCFVTSLFAIVACDKDTNTDDAGKYTVTVQTGETSPAEGVEVKIRKGTTTMAKANTDANGKAEFDLAPDNYTFTLNNLPDHYDVPQNANLTLTAEERNRTITLTEKFAYKVHLVNPDGTPYYAAGVRVGICTLTGNCLPTVPLEAGGLARCEGALGDYHVQIKNLPSGVTFRRDESDPATEDYYIGGEFSETETEMTITIYPVPVVNEITELTPMSNEEKTAYEANNAAYTADNALTAYHITKNLAVGETAYYSITPTVSGDYNIYKDNVASYLRSNELLLGNQGFTVFYAITLEAGKTYYLNVSNTEDHAITANFVLEFPAASYIQVTGADTVDATITKADQNAVVALAPTAGASFKITVLNQSASIKQFDSSEKAEDATHTTFTENAEISVKFTEDMINNYILYFSVAIESPASFQIKVEKLHDLTNTTTPKTVGATLTKFDNVTGKHLVAVPFNRSEDIVYDSNDNCFRLGANGPEVVVMLTKNLERTNFSGEFAYLEEFNRQKLRGSNPFLFDVTTAADKEDLSKGNSYVDYRAFLRGFADYELKPNKQPGSGYDYVRPDTEDYDTQMYYANFVNSDGVYPLTEELKEFLKGFAAKYADSIIGGTEENAWVFACYYYADGTAENDVVVGTYEDDNGRTLTVDANHTFTITQGDNTITGSWQNDGAYTFTEHSFKDIPYTVTRNAQTGALTFTDPENPGEPAYLFTPVSE